MDRFGSFRKSSHRSFTFQYYGAVTHLHLSHDSTWLDDGRIGSNTWLMFRACYIRTFQTILLFVKHLMSQTWVTFLILSMSIYEIFLFLSSTHFPGNFNCDHPHLHHPQQLYSTEKKINTSKYEKFYVIFS
jgi:hypothetical protein